METKKKCFFIQTIMACDGKILPPEFIISASSRYLSTMYNYHLIAKEGVMFEDFLEFFSLYRNFQSFQNIFNLRHRRFPRNRLNIPAKQQISHSSKSI